MLTKEQKAYMVESKINILEGLLFNLDLSTVEEQAKSQPNLDHLSNIAIEKSENLLALEAMNNKLEEVLSE
jgi:hypothetical protein